MAPGGCARAFSWVSRTAGPGQARHFAQSDTDPGVQAKRIQGLERDKQTFHQTRETVSLKSGLVSHWVKPELPTRSRVGDFRAMGDSKAAVSPKTAHPGMRELHPWVERAGSSPGRLLSFSNDSYNTLATPSPFTVCAVTGHSGTEKKGWG